MLDPEFKEFLARAEERVRGSHTEAELIRSLETLVGEVISKSEIIPPDAFLRRQDRFSNNLIYRPLDSVFSLNGAVWLPGQTTPIHDHLTWAVVGVVSGQERETIFRRVDGGADPSHAKLELVSERTNFPGHVTKLGHKGIHRIDNASGLPTLSLHMYGADIGNMERHSYDPLTGEIGKFVSGYCNVLRDIESD